MLLVLRFVYHCPNKVFVNPAEFDGVVTACCINNNYGRTWPCRQEG